MSSLVHAIGWVFSPFELDFMQRALVASLALALGSGPVGVFLVLRRMSLIGDTMSHAILPGVAVGFLITGLSIPAMSVGGIIAGLLVALLAGLATRLTPIKEDANFAAFFIISLAFGVMIVSLHGNDEDLVDVLFGTISDIKDVSLVLMASIATITLFGLALIYRPLVMECFDPVFLRVVKGPGAVSHLFFLILVVLNMVAGFQTLGTLMAIGLMILPAIAARFWANEVWSLSVVAVAIAVAAGFIGLILSYRAALPSGPAVVLTAGGFYVASLVIGSRDSLAAQFFRRRHRTS